MHLYALSGQSNMVFLNPRRGFIPTLATGLGSSDVKVAKRAWPGKPINLWNPDVAGGLYDMWLAKIRKVAAGGDVESAGIVWMQGEKDAVLGTPKNDYWAAAATMLGRLRETMMADFGVKKVPIVIGRISDHKAGVPEWDAIREAQDALAMDLDDAGLVDTDDLNRGAHYFTPNGYQTLGERFAAAMLGLR